MRWQLVCVGSLFALDRLYSGWGVLVSASVLRRDGFRAMFEGLFFLAAGIFVCVCSIGNFDWFMGHRKARFWVSMIGRNGARVFYTLLGLFLTGLGLAFALNLFPNN